ncbi:synaptic vesicle 2-related protein-like isoform X1 [Anneissia japonica]|uniref:synaptic vesicle 2-related protein-like isoform X1 n=1 Tax=Anneissia japonica TaxID=1529436 RepID=UPI001425A6F9|nr:synaptic vesicle 2-related protein-like isoform X1 [Anneissia japonica]
MVSKQDYVYEPVVKFRRSGSGSDDGSGGEVDMASRQPKPRLTHMGNGSTDEVPGNISDDHFTVDEAVENIGFGPFQIKLSGLTGLCWMADAMEMMILSILSPELRCVWNLTRVQEAMITTVVFIGMLISSTLWGKICDKYGRRVGLIACSIWIFYYGVLSCACPVYIWLLILRGLVGFGIGGAPQAVTLYAEFLPAKFRGRCLVFIETFWAIGACFEVVIALAVMPTLGWRYLLAFSALPVLIFIVCCKWLPESARYYVACGQQDKAQAVIKQIAVENKKPMPLGNLKIEGASAKRGRYKDLFKTKEVAITSSLLLFIWFANAFSYYGIVLLTTELFASGEECAVSESSSELRCDAECTTLGTKDYIDLLWTTLAEFPGIILTILLIDLIGRKKTMSILFFLFAIFTLLVLLCTTRTILTVFLFCARAFIVGSFQATYVYTPEVYPTSVRAIGLGACSGLARLGAIIAPFVSQVLLAYSAKLTIGIYAGTTILAAIACLCLPIETKGREMVNAVNSNQSQETYNEEKTVDGNYRQMNDGTT